MDRQPRLTWPIRQRSVTRNMLHLDDFVDHVATSGLVPAAELAQWPRKLDAEPGADASIRLARHLVQQGLLTDVSGPQAPRRRHPGLLPGRIPDPPPPGRGGMGKVYLAVNEEDLSQGRHQGLAPRRRPRKKRAACSGSAARWSSPSGAIIPTWPGRSPWATTGDVYFMVMEYIPGMSLFDMVKSERYGPLRVTDAARLFLKVVDGLDAAHEAGLVHRDIKPSNIMITPDGNAKILDLGLARALGEEKGITRANTVLGTLDYASPEQLSDASQGRRPQRPLQRRLHPLLRPRRPVRRSRGAT